MQKEKARVIEITPDKIILSFEKKAMCDCCRIAPLCNKNQGVFEIPKDSTEFKKSDILEIGIETKKTLEAFLVVFLVPFFIFIVSLVYFRSRGELLSFFLALLVMITYYIGIRIFLKKNKKINLKVLRKIENEK